MNTCRDLSTSVRVCILPSAYMIRLQTHCFYLRCLNYSAQSVFALVRDFATFSTLLPSLTRFTEVDASLCRVKSLPKNFFLSYKWHKIPKNFLRFLILQKPPKKLSKNKISNEVGHYCWTLVCSILKAHCDWISTSNLAAWSQSWAVFHFLL